MCADEKFDRISFSGQKGGGELLLGRELLLGIIRYIYICITVKALFANKVIHYAIYNTLQLLFVKFISAVHQVKPILF